MKQSTESTKNVCLSKQNVSKMLAFQLQLYFTKDKKQKKTKFAISTTSNTVIRKPSGFFMDTTKIVAHYKFVLKIKTIFVIAILHL